MIPTSALDEISCYVPALILRRVTADSGATLAPSVERFPAAVLMADLSGFTALTEYLTRHNPAGAEELTRILDLYFGHLVRVVSAHGGDVVKFAGDGLLALWYGDEAPAVLAQRAVQCGLAVQMMMAPDVWGVSDNGQPPPALKVRVGVGAGMVTTMYLGGVFARWELLVTGPAVLEAGQAEAAAKPGEVLIGPAAWSFVSDACMGSEAAGGAVRLDALLADIPMRALVPPQLQPETVDMLRAYVPKAILTRLDAGQTAWLAEQRRVTVLFVNLPDLRADTPLSHAQSQMRAIQSMLYRYEGSISRLGTDGKGPTLVAALGLPPLSHEDDPERGVRAALDIHNALRELEFSCAIGVTTGMALCGAVGAKERREYTMMGSIVNRSARLMQASATLAQSGRPALLCDAATYQAARRRVPFEPLPPLRLKGVAELVDVYQPLEESRAVVAVQPAPHVPLIGRSREQETLQTALGDLLAERSNLLLLEGEAGIGKSRLLDALREAAQAAHVRVLSGAASPIEKTPYFAWRSIITALFDPQAPANLLGDLAPLSPLLAPILGRDLHETPITAQMTGQMRAENTRELLIRLITQFADQAPLLLILEDAHWLDISSWILLRHILDRVSPLLVALALRPIADLPDEYQRLAYRPHVQRLQLRGLSPEEVGTLIAHRLGVLDVPEPLWRLLAERALGNPFFSEELALALRDSGLITIVDGRCRLAPGAGDLHHVLAAMRLPDTVQGLIISRIDRLSAAQQLTLKVASVIGLSFNLSDLTVIHPVERDHERLVDQLFALQQAGLIAIEGFESELTYSFRPAAACEVAYNLMSFGQRRQLHRQLAERASRPVPARSRPRS
ncbi:MAG: AAA family ATPase, partial [Oscillochloris sp.]|nr:AAA family ATPase [Oscillochloris sp.]